MLAEHLQVMTSNCLATCQTLYLRMPLLATSLPVAYLYAFLCEISEHWSWNQHSALAQCLWIDLVYKLRQLNVLLLTSFLNVISHLSLWSGDIKWCQLGSSYFLVACHFLPSAWPHLMLGLGGVGAKFGADLDTEGTFCKDDTYF